MLLRQMARHWLGQSRAPERIVVSAPEAADVGDLASLSDRIEVVTGPRGLCAQRNTALDHLAGSCELVIFLDDDFVPSANFVDGAVALFTGRPDVMVASGTLLADGINTPGISYADASALVAADDRRVGRELAATVPQLHGYGCNLALRIAAAPDLRFDERLPLYGWQEDLDMSRRLGVHGAIVESSALVGVHMGIKSGRTSGRRLGYSQVANPFYLRRKRIFSRQEALAMASRNILKNAARAFWPEPWVDRRGRLAGNALALWDGLRGRLRPERILDL
jgi:GT2 family glycosyltransferase